MNNRLETIISRNVDSIKNKWNNSIVGIYLAGSYSTKKMSEVFDIDLHAIVDTQKISPFTYNIRTSRYGTLINMPLEFTVRLISDSEVTALIEWGFMPLNSFSVFDKLIKSHDQFACSSNLYHGRILYDPHSFLYNLRIKIEENFNKPEYIRSRIDYVFSLAQTSLHNFKHKPTKLKHYISSVWDGPLWALMSIGNLVLTRRCITPTFRKHLILVKQELMKMCLESYYERLLKTWGIYDISEDEAKTAFENMKIIYGRTIREFGLEKRSMHPFMYQYWIKGIGEMIQSGYAKESIFATIFIMCKCARIIERSQLHGRNNLLSFCIELLNHLGFDISDGCKHKMNEINGLIDEFYTLLRLC